MKRLAVSLILGVVLVAGWSMSAMARGPAGVSNTIHNLSTSAPVDPNFGISLYASNEDEVCIFCHTPHGGTLDGPLWNHPVPTNAFTHYNSATLAPYISGLGVGRALGSESLICMSCHDGSVSVYAMHNNSNNIGAPSNLNLSPGETDIRIIYLPPGGGADIGGGGYDPFTASEIPGGNLSDDHPISFSYSGLLASGDYAPTGPRNGKLRLLVDAEARGVEFYGNDNRVECSSCHDPHVDYIANTSYRPFLITTNVGSYLCLSCHVK